MTDDALGQRTNDAVRFAALTYKRVVAHALNVEEGVAFKGLSRRLQQAREIAKEHLHPAASDRRVERHHAGLRQMPIADVTIANLVKA